MVTYFLVIGRKQGVGTNIAGEQADIVPGPWEGSCGQLCLLREVEAA